MGETRDLYLQGTEQLREVERGGITFHIWIRGDDDLGDILRPNTVQQRPDVELVWPHAIQWCDRTIEDVIAPSKFSCGLDGLDVLRTFDHTDDARLSLGIRTYGTGIDSRHITAG